MINTKDYHGRYSQRVSFHLHPLEGALAFSWKEPLPSNVNTMAILQCPIENKRLWGWAVMTCQARVDSTSQPITELRIGETEEQYIMLNDQRIPTDPKTQKKSANCYQAIFGNFRSDWNKNGGVVWLTPRHGNGIAGHWTVICMTLVPPK